jgi:hypothetical protein
LEVDDETHPSTQNCGSYQRKTPPNSQMKNQAKILQKSQKRKMIHTTWRRDSRRRISYIDENQMSTTYSHSLEDWRDFSLSLLSPVTP